MTSLCILVINCLSDKSFAHIFSQLVGYLFGFTDSSLRYAKTFEFDIVPFVYFAFVSHAWGDISKKKKIAKTIVKEHTVYGFF